MISKNFEEGREKERKRNQIEKNVMAIPILNFASTRAEGM